MPQDVSLTGSIQGAARRLQDLCDPGHRASIDEEQEAMEVGEFKAGGVDSMQEGYPQVNVCFQC